MHPLRLRKLKLILLGITVIAVACGLILYALRQNISLFYSPSQVIAGEAPLKRSVRVGGVVVAHSVVRDRQGLGVRFRLTDFEQTVEVFYRGVLPDLFREGQGVVTQGVLVDNAHINASQVLAKHDENYMPPEVKSTLKPTHIGSVDSSSISPSRSRGQAAGRRALKGTS